ncbi:MAG: FkbM family methyltransferase [Gammaproteobacteria bacterium]|nr:FkbM family methyltransferase [Gammaproteobacteria bacterium]
MRRAIRGLLGDAAYRRITQYPRILRMAVYPKPPRETAALPLLLRPGDVAIDVGANYGQYVRVMSPLVGTQGRVHAIEPSAITLSGLRLMCRLLRTRNVSFHELAVADENGRMQLEIPIKPGGRLGVGLAHLATGGSGPAIFETVEVTTLDRFVESHDVRNCALVKCDVEGAEYRVLRGALRTLEKFRPRLILEVKAAQLARYGNTIAQLEELLQDLDYDFHLWRDGRLVRVTRFDESPNFIFLPRGKI